MNQDESFGSPANPAELLYEALIKSYILIKDGDDRFFEQYLLGKTRFYALVHLKRKPGLSPSELSKRLLCTKGNATRIMKSLEAEGHLRRNEAANDRRAQQIYLTPAGEELLNRARQTFSQFQEDRFAWLDETEKMVLQAALEKLNGLLEASLHQT